MTLEEVYIVLHFIVWYVIAIIKLSCTYACPLAIEVGRSNVLIKQIYAILIVYLLDFLVPRVITLRESHA
ncbi:MAG TPA: hypothetical protein DEQ17_03690 [Prevotella sp.]|nr:hypothetical protein [Prevotella sp.]